MMLELYPRQLPATLHFVRHHNNELLRVLTVYERGTFKLPSLADLGCVDPVGVRIYYADGQVTYKAPGNPDLIWESK